MANAGGQVKIKAKTGGGSTVWGIALILVSLLMLGTRLDQALPLSVAQWIGRLVYALLCYGGVGLLSKGLRLRGLSGRLLRLQGLFDNSRRVPLALAAEAAGSSLTALVQDVRDMQKYGMVKGMYADLIRGELVFSGDQAAIPPPEREAEPSGIILREDRKKSALPIYALGLAWVLYAIFFPMFHITDYLLALILSLIAFFTTAWRTPDRVVIGEEVRVVPAPDPTGDAALDEMLLGVQRQIADLRRLDRAIDGKLDGPVRDILSTTEQIVEQLRRHPQSAGQMRQFFNYTLPTTISLLQNYDELSNQPVKGRNITQAMEKIEGMIGTIVEAFHRQLDALFQDKALNIAVELEVMEGMLHQSGDIRDAFDDLKQ